MKETPILSLCEFKEVRAVPIPDLLATAIYDYQAKYHEMPLGLLIGPNEFVSFREYLRTSRHMMYAGGYSVAAGGAMKFHGVPIRLKQRPGIECEVSDSIAMRLAIGIAKTSK